MSDDQTPRKPRFSSPNHVHCLECGAIIDLTIADPDAVTKHQCSVGDLMHHAGLI